MRVEVAYPRNTRGPAMKVRAARERMVYDPSARVTVYSARALAALALAPAWEPDLSEPDLSAPDRRERHRRPHPEAAERPTWAGWRPSSSPRRRAPSAHAPPRDRSPQH